MCLNYHSVPAVCLINWLTSRIIIATSVWRIAAECRGLWNEDVDINHAKQMLLTIVHAIISVKLCQQSLPTPHYPGHRPQLRGGAAVARWRPVRCYGSCFHDVKVGPACRAVVGGRRQQGMSRYNQSGPQAISCSCSCESLICISKGNARRGMVEM